MEALKTLVTNVPDWLKRLDDLNGQIDQRQQELAQLTESQSPSGGATTKSIKNKGSTESLKPRDEPAAHPSEPPTTPAAEQSAEPTSVPPLTTDIALALASGSNPADNGVPHPSSPAGSETPSAKQRQLTSQVKALGQARAKATLRKRQRTDSVISAEGAAPKYRTRSMIIVYYDSYVQSFFEELVKFVSSSRNMMRKAKMAARVAHIKRMAELEMPEEEEDSGVIAADAVITPDASSPALSPSLAPDGLLQAAQVGSNEEEELPPLRYMSTRMMHPRTSSPQMLVATNGRSRFSRGAANSSRALFGTTDQQPDIYDELDKALEYVQSMCEHAAHQFLRDGDCGEEVANIKRRLQETKDLSDKEMERVKKEDPAALEAPPEGVAKGRSYRPQSMRRDQSSAKPSSPAPDLTPSTALEVDEGIDDMDQDDMPLPKLAYKSTRQMR